MKFKKYPNYRRQDVMGFEIHSQEKNPKDLCAGKDGRCYYMKGAKGKQEFPKCECHRLTAEPSTPDINFVDVPLELLVINHPRVAWFFSRWGTEYQRRMYQ